MSVERAAFRVLEDYEFAYRVNRECPELVTLLVDPKHGRREVVEKLHEDPVLFAHLVLGFKPTEFQAAMLRDHGLWQVGRIARQGGKTTAVIGVRALHFLMTTYRTTTLIVAPSFRQAMIVRDKLQPHLDNIPEGVKALWFSPTQRNVQKQRIASGLTQSRLYFLPNSPDKIRGFTADAILVDEAGMFKNAEYLIDEVLTPMTNATRLRGYGFILVYSTPKAKGSFFWELCKGSRSKDWRQHWYTWRDVVKAGLADEALIEKLRATWLPSKFTQEYEADFTEEEDAWLPTELVLKCIDSELEYVDFTESLNGRFYAGVDLGQKQDHSVIALFESRGEEFILRYVKRFPLDTPYATVIGHLKVLADRYDRVQRICVDQGGERFVVEEMRNVIGDRVEGVTLSRERKQEVATCLRERVTRGLRELEPGRWENSFRIPYDPQVIEELTVERYEQDKDGSMKFSHPSGTHDDVFWAVGLAAYAARSQQPSGGGLLRA